MRSFIVFLCFIPVLLFSCRSVSLETQLKEAIKDKKAEIGIAVIIDEKDTVTVNNDIHYPLMSVFKFHQALALADYMAKRNQSLDTLLRIEKSDLKPDTYSPLRDKYPQGEIEMSIADLLRYTLQQSDNNACDILFNYQGGTDAVDKYIHSLGIQDCAIVGTESAMHEYAVGCRRAIGDFPTGTVICKRIKGFYLADNGRMPDRTRPTGRSITG